MDQILMHYLQVSQHMSQQFRNHFGKLNLTFPQALALNILGSEGPMPISRLAERTGSANSTISGIVDRLGGWLLCGFLPSSIELEETNTGRI